MTDTSQTAVATRVMGTNALLLRAAHTVNRAIAAEIERAGFSYRPGHGAVLARLEPGGVRMTELAGRVGVTKATLTQLVDELETAGYLQRDVQYPRRQTP